MAHTQISAAQIAENPRTKSSTMVIIIITLMEYDFTLRFRRGRPSIRSLV